MCKHFTIFVRLVAATMPWRWSHLTLAQALPELVVVSFSTGNPIYHEYLNRLQQNCSTWSVDTSMDTFPLMPDDEKLVDVSSVVSSLDGIAGLTAGQGLLSGTWPLQYIHSFKPLFMW